MAKVGDRKKFVLNHLPSTRYLKVGVTSQLAGTQWRVCRRDVRVANLARSFIRPEEHVGVVKSEKTGTHCGRLESTAEAQKRFKQRYDRYGIECLFPSGKHQAPLLVVSWHHFATLTGGAFP